MILLDIFLVGFNSDRQEEVRRIYDMNVEKVYEEEEGVEEGRKRNRKYELWLKMLLRSLIFCMLIK